MNIWALVKAAFSRQQPGEPRLYISARQAGVQVNEDTALTYSAVWACVRVISETIGAMPWHVYRRTDDGREPIDNALRWLLNGQPCPEMTAVAFREAIIAHALTWGNGYAEIERDMADRPRALWLMAPDRTTPKRTDTGELVYEHVGTDGRPYVLPARNVFHLHGLSFDGLVGYSPIRMAARSIGLGIAQDTFGASFYANGTTYGQMVEVPAKMSEEQIEQLQNYLENRHQGPDKAFRTKIIANGAKPLPATGMPMTDAQFIESRRFSVNDVARWYRVPPHKIADLERSTNNNIEHQSIEFVTDTLVPWCTRLEQEANIKLVGPRSQGSIYTKFSLNAQMRGDSKARGEFYRTMTQIGAMTINEVRALEELNGIGADGDEVLVQLNQTTLDKLVNEPEPAPAAAPPDDATPPDESQQDDPQAPTNVIRAEALAFWRNQA